MDSRVVSAAFKKGRFIMDHYAIQVPLEYITRELGVTRSRKYLEDTISWAWIVASLWHLKINTLKYISYDDPLWLWRIRCLMRSRATTEPSMHALRTECLLCVYSADTWRNNNVILRQNDVATSFWRNSDVIITPCVRWVHMQHLWLLCCQIEPF